MELYLSLPGVTGDVTTPGYAGAIQLDSFQFGVTAAPGKSLPTYSDLLVSTSDAIVAVPILADLARGPILATVTLSVVDLSSGAPVLVLQLVLDSVVIDEYTADEPDSAGGAIGVTFSLHFASAALTVGSGVTPVVPEAPSAVLLPAVAAAAAGAAVLRRRSKARAATELVTSNTTSGVTPTGLDES